VTRGHDTREAAIFTTAEDPAETARAIDDFVGLVALEGGSGAVTFRVRPGPRRYIAWAWKGGHWAKGRSRWRWLAKQKAYLAWAREQVERERMREEIEV
jgi:hypothetical protein